MNKTFQSHPTSRNRSKLRWNTADSWRLQSPVSFSSFTVLSLVSINIAINASGWFIQITQSGPLVLNQLGRTLSFSHGFGLTKRPSHEQLFFLFFYFKVWFSGPETSSSPYAGTMSLGHTDSQEGEMKTTYSSVFWSLRRFASLNPTEGVKKKKKKKYKRPL